MTEATKIKHVFRSFPSYTALDQFTLHNDFIEEFQIHSETELSNVARFLEEDHLIVWFQNKKAVAFIDGKDGYVTPLDIRADLHKFPPKGFDSTEAQFDAVAATEIDLKRTSKKDVKYVSKGIAVVYNIDCIDKEAAELRVAIAIATIKFPDGINIPSLKQLFNKYVAQNPDTCCVVIMANAINGEVKVTERLSWKSTHLSNGSKINGTVPVWQVSCISARDVANLFGADLELIQREPGAFVSKQDAAWLYSTAAVTRYFQKEPSSVEFDTMKRKFGIKEADTTMVLYRPAGIVSYELLDINDFTI